ncbi:MAG: ATP-binding protein [Verrucomicrobia bacterium]|nr:ATP-binding protein [Verrucomicrobiota bacterium]
MRLIKQQGSGEHKEVKVTIGKQGRWLEVTGTRLPEQKTDEGVLTLFVLHDISAMKNLERMRTDFVANVSHELRTPVTIIKGYVDTLVEDRTTLDDSEQERFLQKIQRNVSRLHELLEDLLMLSRLESSMEVLELEPLKLTPLLNELADNFNMRLEAGKQTIEVKIESSCDQVLADKLRIQQVLENLMENVLRHAKGFTSMNLRVERLDKFLCCWVEDNGQGIPPTEIPHIFERFYRVDKSRSRESGGTGLGLSIVKHIIQQHGGKVFGGKPSGARVQELDFNCL